ncbi:hypothetical protein L2D01_05330 [Hyphomonadaceae bacterium ML37]|nr:hypothetical protein L2D01_05330 [Hyphomonadaceae bacterium ML37]
MSAPSEQASISTKSEMLMRLRTRPKPSASLDLRPAVAITADVHRKIAKENEERIQRLKRSLESARMKAETHHTFSRLGGYSKAQFERAR